MNKNKKFTITIVVIFCLLLQTVFAGSVLATVAPQGVKAALKGNSETNTYYCMNVDLKTIQSGNLEGDGFSVKETGQVSEKALNKKGSAGKKAQVMANQSLEDYIAQQLNNRSEYIDITAYKLKVDADHVSEVLLAAENAINNHPELFFVGTDCRLYYGMGKVKGLSITYSMSAAETKQAVKSFDREVNSALSVVKEEMNPEQKALAIYDYLATNGQYDHRYDSDGAPDISFRAYGILVNKLGVCQSYSLAFKYLMDKLEIPCGYVSSDSMDHVWNVVTIDGLDYQLDLTWGDSGNSGRDVLGYADHKYFLVDKKTMAQDHKEADNWEYSAGFSKGAESPYQGYSFWKSIKSAIYPVGEEYYYIKGNHLKQGAGQETDRTLAEGALSLASTKDSIYYSRENGIYKIDKTLDGQECVFSATGITDFAIIDHTGWFTSSDGTKYAIALEDTAPALQSPQLFSVQKQNDTGVVITWNPVFLASGYEIYRKTEGSDGYKLIAKTGKQTSYQDSGMVGGASYSYGIKAVGQQFGGAKFASPMSYQKSVSILLASPVLKVDKEGLQSVSLKWNSVNGAAGYKLYRAESAAGKYKQIMTVRKGSTAKGTYKNSKMIPGKSYYYKIRSYQIKSGVTYNGRISSAVVAKAVPASPSINVSSAGRTIVNVQWKQVAGASGYEVFRAQGNSTVYHRMKSRYGDKMTTFKNIGIKPGQTYYYKVRAYKTVKGKKIYSSFSSIKGKKI